MLLGYQGWPYELKQNYLVLQASDNAACAPTSSAMFVLMSKRQSI